MLVLISCLVLILTCVEFVDDCVVFGVGARVTFGVGARVVFGVGARVVFRVVVSRTYRAGDRVCA